MRYCSNCGQKVDDEAKFCSNCGAAIVISSENTQSQRKVAYDGVIHKCPNCGEILNSFTSQCPACGYELRGTIASNSVKELYKNIQAAKSDNEVVRLIKVFPVPNNKEDILEFMVLAASCFDADHQLMGDNIQQEIADAWFAKLEQGYQKARLLFPNDADFSKIQNIYEKANQKIHLTVNFAQRKELLRLILRTIGLWGGFLVLLIAFFVDITARTTNTSILHLGGAAIMIIGALMVRKKASKLMDVGIGVSAALLAILLGMLLQEQFSGNGSIMELGGGATLIITIIQLVRKNKK